MFKISSRDLKKATLLAMYTKKNCQGYQSSRCTRPQRVPTVPPCGAKEVLQEHRAGFPAVPDPWYVARDLLSYLLAPPLQPINSCPSRKSPAWSYT